MIDVTRFFEVVPGIIGVDLQRDGPDIAGAGPVIGLVLEGVGTIKVQFRRIVKGAIGVED